MKKTLIAVVVLGLMGCATSTSKRETYDLINAEMTKSAATDKTAAVPNTVSNALLPPMQTIRPSVARPIEERFSVTFNNVPAAQFFTAIAAGTRYNMLIHPNVAGTISANLKDVTLFEALDAIRDMYGYDYTVDGNRISIKPLTLQTRIFHINYLTGNRSGASETRVSSGLGSSPQRNSSTSSATGSQSNQSGNSGGQSQARVTESSKVSSSSNSDFWGELKDSLRAIVGIEERGTTIPGKEGRSVVVSPQSGVIVVRAMPDELRAVSDYLKLAQISVERQVILEAKILEVQLNDSFQAGVNWASFASIAGIRDNRTAAGFIAPGTTLASAAHSNDLSSTISATSPISGNVGNATLNATTSLALSAAGNPAGSIFGFAFQTNNFATLLTFLETQGTVHVLSSPRIATLNNQKAILKVGTDDFFVTNVSSNQNTTATSTTTTPEVTLQQFFSGVVLDVTPQIDEDNNITLHVHPSVTQVTTQNKLVELGTLGTLNLPLASSNTSETDSVVRGQNGRIIAIGGLMRQSTTADKSQVPGAGDVPILGGLFRNTNRVTQKRELVILIKPTVVQDGAAWDKDMQESQRRIQSLDPSAAAERK
jgi:MSHA biogenesis protein MshL